MDVRTELRESLMTRRGKLTPQDLGIVTFGVRARRVPGLRRDEVAQLAGMSVDYYVRFERGQVTGASPGVVEALARAP